MVVGDPELQHIPRILALDGGGVRGLSSLLILEKLMREIQRLKGDSQPPLPCQYFDLICGTSTGGLIAIMLGRLRMPVDVCITKYMKLSKQVFRFDNVVKSIPVGSEHCRFNEEPLVKALKDIIKEYTDNENTPIADPHDHGPNSCPVFVVAMEGQDAGGPVKLFRSYGFYKDQCPIWQAARATSAAPSYFPPAWVEVPDPGGWYIDGGLRHNNPSEVALSEARKYWKTVKRFCIVSIGTGTQKPVDFIQLASVDTDSEDSDGAEDDVPNSEEATNSTSTRKFKRFKRAAGNAISSALVNIGTAVSKVPLATSAIQLSRVPGGILTLKRFAEELVKLSTESEDTHRRMWELANNAHDESLRFPYYRFNVPAGMEEIGLEEWKEITKMGALTRGYLATPPIESNIEECAKTLSSPASIERIPHACFTMSYEMTEEEQRCLWDLRLIDPRDEIKKIEDRKDPLFKGSYAWVLGCKEYKNFINWEDSNKHRLLWIKGDAGKGKTMLLLGIIRELERLNSNPDSPNLSYFFCQGTNSTLNTPTAVLRCLVWLVLVQQPSLISYVRDKYVTAGPNLFKDDNAFYVLRDAFKNMLKDTRLKRAFLIVDALDECIDKDKPGLAQLLDFISTTVVTSPNIKWLVSSRNRPDIESRLRDGEGRVRLDLELNSECIRNAVDAYIDHKLSELDRLKHYEEERVQIAQELRQKADGTFLWVALVCKELESVESYDALAVLGEMPSKLKDLYGRMMRQIEELKRDDPKYCKRVLSTIILAYEPLHVSELEILTALPKHVPLPDIIKKCASFLTIRDDVVYPVHQSAKDYLTIDAESEILPDGRAKGHVMILSQSLHAMSNTFRRDIYGLLDPGRSIEHINYPNPDPLTRIRYACLYWIDHLYDPDHGLYDQVDLFDNREIHIFLKKHFLHWLEALSLMRSMSMGVVMIRKLEGLLAQHSNTAMDFLSMIRDANRFILYNKFIIEEYPLQVYASALVFSPTKSKIKLLFRDERPPWIITSPRVDENWSSCLQPLGGHTASVTSVAFSHDGRWLASSSYDRTVRIWDAETGALQGTLEGHTNHVFSVAFSHDGRIASGSGDTVWIWDAETKALQGTLKGHTDAVLSDSDEVLSDADKVLSVAFSHDGRLASGSSDGTVRIWHTETGALQGTLEGHTDSGTSVAFSHDGRWLASRSYKEVLIWDAETRELQRTLEGHTDPVTSVAFSHDGRLASGSRDGTVRIWDAETGALQGTLKGHTDAVLSDTDKVLSVAFSHDGRLASGSVDGTVRIWHPETGALRMTSKKHTSWVWSVAFSHDGLRLASGSHDGTVRMWDTEMREPQETPEGHTFELYSMAFSHDGLWLASGSADRTVRIWDAKTGALRRILKGHTDVVTSVAFSHDGRLASGSTDQTVRIWDAETGALQGTLKGHNRDGRSVSVAFSPNGRWLASGSGDETVRIWDAETRALQGTLEGHTNHVFSVAFSHDGRLASGSGDTVRIWDAKTKALQRTLKGHTRAVRSVAFSHDARRLASSSFDETVRIWDAETGALQGMLKIDACLTTLSFSSDEFHLITDLGCITLDRGSLLPIRTPNWSGYCLHANQSWITWNGKNILWLPPEYRPVRSMIRKGTVAIGCASGRVLLIAGNTLP